MLSTYVKPLSSGSVFPWLTADRIVTTNSLSQLATPSSVSTAQSVALTGSATLTVAGLIAAQSSLTVASTVTLTLLTASRITTTNSASAVSTPSAISTDQTLTLNGAAATSVLRTTGTATGANWSGRVVAGGPTSVFLMGQYNDQAWLGAHNAALSAWADFYLNPDGGQALFLGKFAYADGAASLVKLDNNTGAVWLRGALAGAVGAPTTSETAPQSISAWDNTKHILLGGVIAGGNSGSLAISYNRSTEEPSLIALSPGSAWLGMKFWADSYSWHTAGSTTAKATLSSAGIFSVSSTSASAITCSGGISTGNTTLHTTTAALTDGAAANVGTLTNAPAAGNPTKWVSINDNGTTRWIPTW